METIRCGLKKAIVGKKIADVEVRVEKLFHGNKKDIVGKKVIDVDRRAKQIIIDVEGDNDLLIHLKMTGQLIFHSSSFDAGSLSKKRTTNLPAGRHGDRQPTTNHKRQSTDYVAGGHPSNDWFEDMPNSTTHIIFDFSDGSKLFFNDLRKFGWIKVFNSKKLKNKLTEELGIEPFDKEFSSKKLAEIIKKKPSWNIKKVLTDQTLISGIGNIYADEALFWAGISPERKAKDISESEVGKLKDAIIKSLGIGLKYGGSSENTYVQIDGSRGQAQEHFQVYSRGGEKCRHCGGIIKKIRLNGRGTHFCPKCQK